MTRLLMAAALVAALVAGCSTGEKYGALNAAAPAVQVKDVLLDAANAGREVRLKGKITVQCASSGCWFFLQDGTGQILVDLQGLGLGLPQRSGKTAEVSGTVKVDREGQATIEAKGLVIS